MSDLSALAVRQTLGAAQTVLLPVTARIIVPAKFDPDSCLITELPTYITVPVDKQGNAILPPVVPQIPGLGQLPGFQPVIKLLPQPIRAIFGLP